MNFKSMVARDIKEVFHNSNEFAEKKIVIFNGCEYEIPIILDHTEAKDRKRPSGDNSEGIFLVDVVAYISFEDLKTIPRKGQQIEIEDNLFNIATVSNEDGEIILGLEMLDE